MDVPARSTPLFEQIHDILWRKILAGEIVPTQRLKDVQWAEKLGVSRTPIREAMRKMQQEGILIPLSQGGYEVRAVSMVDLQGLYRCRTALEVQAAREAAETFTPAVAKRFNDLIRETDNAITRKDLARVLELNSEFHRALIDQSGNVHLINLCDTIRKLILYYRTALLNQAKNDPQRQEDYIKRLLTKQKEHRTIVKALARQDSQEAAHLMERHLLKTAQHMDLQPQASAT